MKQAVLIALFGIFGMAYGQQLQNAGFEMWEVENGKTEPVNWSSIQTALPTSTAALAPLVIFESGNAHSGDKCIKLENISTFGVVANGIVTTGRIFASLDPTKGYIFTDVNDSRWNSELTQRPDSIVGWYQYTPSGNDVASVVAIIHGDTVRHPDEDSANYIGAAKIEFTNATAAGWVRFSVPFTYYNNDTPEYILVTLTSGNGTNAVAGSVALFDDIELIYNPVSVDELAQADAFQIYGHQGIIEVDFSFIKNPMNVEVKIYDIMGKQHIYSVVESGTKETYTDLNPGIYIAVMEVNGETLTKKVVVQ